MVNIAKACELPASRRRAMTTHIDINDERVRDAIKPSDLAQGGARIRAGNAKG